MKKSNLTILITVLLFIFIFSSCDDAGIDHSIQKKGIISFSQKNLRRLNPSVDGVYELWIRLDSTSTEAYFSLGKFNIGTDGITIVNLSEQPMTFQFTGDTNLLFQATMAVVSIENTDPNLTPSSRRLMSVKLGNNQDSIWGKLTIGGELAMDQTGRSLYTAPPAFYMMQTPSQRVGSPGCYKGIWFASVTGDTSFMPAGIAFTPGRGWVYEAWVADTLNASNPIYYSMGRFYDPLGPDSDGKGACAGPNPGFNSPGQDWILPGCVGGGKPDIVNLAAGYYQVYITIEPENETPGSTAYNTPFFFKIYKCAANFINPLLACYQKDVMSNTPWTFNLWPEGKLYITN